MIEDIEESVLRSRLACQLLDIVDEQYVDRLVEMDEIRNLALFVRCLELGLKLVHRDVKYLQFRMALPHFVSDGLHDVGLAQARVAPNVERIERCVARGDGDGHTSRTCQPVAFAFDERVECQTCIELRVDDDFFDTRNDERIL